MLLFQASTWVWLMLITYCVEANLPNRQREEDINYDSYGSAGAKTIKCMYKMYKMHVNSTGETRGIVLP